MILGIDASNIRSGGGLTHLMQLLTNSAKTRSGFTKVVVWSNASTLKALPNYDWLIKKSHFLLNKGAICSYLFQIFLFASYAKNNKCAIIFAPGSTFLSTFRPFVTLSQNMLPFETQESSRFPGATDRLRFKLLLLLQSYTFKKANGLIFLTKYAQEYIAQKTGLLNENNVIIPHGVSAVFQKKPKLQNVIGRYTLANPFKFLYVSIVTVYKHQWNVAKAVMKLRSDGYPVELTLIGPSTAAGLAKLNVVLEKSSFSNSVRYLGAVAHNEIAQHYKETDAFVFASTCENMPIILIEAMTAGLPIACSEKQPMPEVLGAGGLYFNALDEESIYLTLKNLLDNPAKRFVVANTAYQNTLGYNWVNCSNATFEFIMKTTIDYKKKQCLKIKPS
jgi:glycosyltransferase involved in cell wall biosynthesis